MLKPNFTAENVLVLRLTSLINDESKDGYVLSPTAKIIYGSGYGRMIPVIYDSAEQTPVGTARMFRRGDNIYADVTLHATAYKVSYTQAMLAKLFPCACFAATSISKNVLKAIDITHIVLSSSGNADPKVPPLGDKIQPIPDQRSMH